MGKPTTMLGSPLEPQDLFFDMTSSAPIPAGSDLLVAAGGAICTACDSSCALLDLLLTDGTGAGPAGFKLP